jgi:hypothetical protein
MFKKTFGVTQSRGTETIQTRTICKKQNSQKVDSPVKTFQTNFFFQYQSVLWIGIVLMPIGFRINNTAREEDG